MAHLFHRLRFTALLAASLWGQLALAPSPIHANDAVLTVQQRMVKIFGAGGFANLESYGTGFLISPRGHIVTVWSHVLDGDSVTVILNDGRRYQGRVVGAEPELDLALLKIDAEDLDHFDLAADAVQAGPGTRILAFSNMFKVATGDEPVSVLHGTIAAKTRLTARRGRFEVPYRGPVYIVDAITNNPGAAGGVLTTLDGRLLGMIGRELRNRESNTWMNYAIPIEELTPTILAIRDGRTVEPTPAAENAATGYTALDLGIVLVPDVLYRTPAFVEEVIPDSPAARLDLQPDDLVVFVNDQLVHSIRSLNEQLRQLQAEDDLTIVVRRGKQLVSMKMVVPRKQD